MRYIRFYDKAGHTITHEKASSTRTLAATIYEAHMKCKKISASSYQVFANSTRITPVRFVR